VVFQVILTKPRFSSRTEAHVDDMATENGTESAAFPKTPPEYRKSSDFTAFGRFFPTDGLLGGFQAIFRLFPPSVLSGNRPDPPTRRPKPTV